MEFQVKETTEQLISWIANWFLKNGDGCNAIVGISGGKDSSVVAALCAAALGKDRVIGVLMPNGVQQDIDMAERLVSHLGICSFRVNIRGAYDALLAEISAMMPVETATVTNLPPRLRMSTLYAVGQSQNGRVANTCNLSEDWVGYSTRYGDSAGDFSPLAHLTVGEVKAIGSFLGLPDALVNKVPSDGLCGKTDEDNLGFSYAVLDRYIRTGMCEDEATRQRIDSLHQKNLFKLQLMPSFPYAPKTK